MFGKYISKTDEQNKNQLIIPAKAVIGSEKDPQVYVVKNGKALRKSIDVGARYPDKLSVNHGLKPGDTIVTAGFINLFDGARVITE